MRHPKLPKRPPVKSLQDIELDEQIWKPDFDIISRYQSFETEIIRLCLLGIAGYGFIISQIKMDNMLPIFESLKHQKPLLMIGLLALGFSLALALTHRFMSTQCLFLPLLVFPKNLFIRINPLTAIFACSPQEACWRLFNICNASILNE